MALGEIGSGKTSVALATTAARGCRRVLVVCPPHLLARWAEQAAAVLPTAVSMVLDTVTSVEVFFMPGDTNDMRIGILSRERAKLGHGWASVSAPACPKCGGPLDPAHDYTVKRETCGLEGRRPGNVSARWVVKNLPILAMYFPKHALVQRLFPTTPARARALRVYEANPLPVDDRLKALVLELAQPGLSEDLARRLVWALGSEAVTRILYATATDVSWEKDGDWKALALAAPEPIGQWGTSSSAAFGGTTSWSSWERYHARLHGARRQSPTGRRELVGLEKDARGADLPCSAGSGSCSRPPNQGTCW